MSELKKRDWITRISDIFNKLELNILYSAPSIRKFLRKHCGDSISAPTVEDLLAATIKAQEEGLQFKINNKIRKLVLRETANGDKLYELIEI